MSHTSCEDGVNLTLTPKSPMNKVLLEAVKKVDSILTSQLDCEAKLREIRDYKLIEKVVSVPKLEYITTQVERIEWVPVKREMPI